MPVSICYHRGHGDELGLDAYYVAFGNFFGWRRSGLLRICLPANFTRPLLVRLLLAIHLLHSLSWRDRRSTQNTK
jgi:hypothetical protein